MMVSREPTALIVDDDFMFVMHASTIMSDVGYRPMEVADAKQALNLLEAEDGEIELLLVDIQMPGMNGFELARIVHERWPKVEILVASGGVRPKPGELPDNATFFPKPVDIEALRAHIGGKGHEGRDRVL